MINPSIIQLLVGVLVGIGAGYLGSFMVLRRMSLVGDALSHVALPGIAIALLLGINPFLGGFLALILAILGIWNLEKRTSLPSETLVGILFTISLAIGLLITPEPELLEALFGDISKIGSFDVLLTAVLVLTIMVVMPKIVPGTVLGVISPDLAQSAKVKLSKINLIFLIMVAVVVALGLKVAGTLLMGSLVIIPAAAAKNISRDLTSYTRMSALFGALSAFVGILVANFYGIAPGPIVVLAGGVLFLITLAARKKI